MDETFETYPLLLYDGSPSLQPNLPDRAPQMALPGLLGRRGERQASNSNYSYEFGI